MTVRPIIFSRSMARALVEGRKTQTRRIMREDLSEGKPFQGSNGLWMFKYKQGKYVSKLSTQFCVGDLLWVRESCRAERMPEDEVEGIRYLADNSFRQIGDGFGSSDQWLRIFKARNGTTSWQGKDVPSIHMPMWVSRITLSVTDVKFQRLQDISEEDARAEGISVLPLQDENDPSAWWQSSPGVHQARSPRRSFHMLWNDLNESRGFGWDTNPCVCAISFTVQMANVAAHERTGEAHEVTA